jgi:trigger factor
MSDPTTPTSASTPTDASTPAPTPTSASTPTDVAEQHDHEHEHDHDHPEAEKAKPITIELEDLTDEGKAKLEKELRRSIPDRPFVIVEQVAKPGAEIELKVELSGDAFREEQQVLLGDLSKEVVLPGFRKGKAPVGLILRRMGEEAARNTIASLATNVLRQEQAKQKWSLLAKPYVLEFAVPSKDDDKVKLSIELELAPKVELQQYKGFAVEVERRDVTDAMVEARLEELRRQSAVQDVADADHGLADEDVVTVDVEATSETGERLEHLCQQGRPLYAWRRNLPNEVVEGMAGKKTGETAEAVVVNKTTNRRGEEIVHNDHYKVTIKEIRCAKMPALDDAFAKDLGDHENLDALRVKIRQDLAKAEEERRRSEGLAKIYRAMIEKNPIDVPRSLVARQEYLQIANDSQQMQRYGLRLEQVVQDTEKYLRDQRAEADETVRLQLLMAELVKTEHVQASDADMEAEIARLAEETGRKPLAIRARLEAQNQLDDFRQNLAKRKIGDFLLANNTVNVVEPKADNVVEPKAE